MGRKKLGLRFVFIPAGIAHKNLASVLPGTEWERLRRLVVERAGARCEACGSKVSPRCHEVWKFNDRRHVARITRLRALCESCHVATHADSEKDLRMVGRDSHISVKEHFMRVNGLSEQEFWRHWKAETERLERRHDYKWTVDYGRYKLRVKRSRTKGGHHGSL